MARTRIHPLTDARGHCGTALVIVADVTDRKLAEERILSYQEQLRSLSSQLGLLELRERQRLAGELHDRIGQALAIAKMRLGSLRANASGELLPMVDEIRLLIDTTIQETRTLTFELSPPILHELGFEPALEWLVERFRGKWGMPVTFQDDGAPKPLAANIKALLFQSTQELLMNVAKHASARHVEVRVARLGGEIRVSVTDDGVGWNAVDWSTTDPRATGFGLFSYRERLFALGGRLEIDSRPGKAPGSG